MACGCKRKRKSLDYVRGLATNFAKITKQEVQIYEETFNDLEGTQILYNFEPVDNTRENIIEYIKP